MAHFVRIVVRALVATMILWFLISIPLPLLPAQSFLMVQVPASVFLFVIYMGKLLVDTFFFDRYPQ
jgi:hypothetical protein